MLIFASTLIGRAAILRPRESPCCANRRAFIHQVSVIFDISWWLNIKKNSQATTAETKIATVTEPKINFGQECVNSLMEEMGPSSLLASLDGSFLFSTSWCSQICISTPVLVVDSTAHAQLSGPPIWSRKWRRRENVENHDSTVCYKGSVPEWQPNRSGIFVLNANSRTRIRTDTPSGL